MPWTNKSKVHLYWEESGSGEPLLMIMGLSFSLAMWGDLRPLLAGRFRTIALDNRCVGRSSCPAAPFSVADMAADAISVLDAAGVEKANVLGFSMGGMIAQEMALSWPQRVGRLILGCTHAGGPGCVRAEARVLRLLTSPFMTPERKLAAMIPHLYYPDTPKERIEADAERMLANPPGLRGYLMQIGAVAFWDSWSRLPQLACPALVVHGDSDLLIPVENARILASRIPGAELVILPRAGHIFHTDQPELTGEALLSFLCQPVARH